MNIGNGLKAIVNVGFWILIGIVIILVILGGLGSWTFSQVLMALIFGIGILDSLPILIVTSLGLILAFTRPILG